jgi:hypothetical protein
LKKKKKTLGGISIFVGVNLTPLPFFIHWIFKKFQSTMHSYECGENFGKKGPEFFLIFF